MVDAIILPERNNTSYTSNVEGASIIPRNDSRRKNTSLTSPTPPL